MSDTRRLKITLQEKGKKPRTVLDLDVWEASLKINQPWEEIRSNPAMFAAMAGAPHDVVMELPGEQVAYHHSGSEIEVTYTLRFTAANGKITEFRAAY